MGAAAAAVEAVGAAGAGILIVGDAVGLGGRLIRTVSFFGWTLAASAGLGGRAPPGAAGGGVGTFSAINSFASVEAKSRTQQCQTSFVQRRVHGCIQRLSVTGLSWSRRQPCLPWRRLAILRGDEGNQARGKHGKAFFFTRRADGPSAIRQAGQPAPHERTLRDARRLHRHLTPTEPCVKRCIPMLPVMLVGRVRPGAPPEHDVTIQWAAGWDRPALPTTSGSTVRQASPNLPLESRRAAF